MGDSGDGHGPYTTVYNRYNRWAKQGVWLRVFEALRARAPEALAPAAIRIRIKYDETTT